MNKFNASLGGFRFEPAVRHGREPRRHERVNTRLVRDIVLEEEACELLPTLEHLDLMAWDWVGQAYLYREGKTTLHVTVWWSEFRSEGVLLMRDYSKRGSTAELRKFRTTECEHDYRERDPARARSGWHQETCAKCGERREYDSSG